MWTTLTLLALLTSLAQDAQKAPLTPGALVVLAGGSEVPFPTILEALASPDPQVRAIGARVAGVFGAISTAGAIATALEKESDPLAGAELIRTLLFFRTREALPVVERHGSRIGVAARLVPLEWLARNDSDAFIQGLPDVVAALGKPDAHRLAPLVYFLADTLARPALSQQYHALIGIEEPEKVLPYDQPVAAKLLPVWIPGLVRAAADAAGCRLGSDLRFGYARLTFGPDGRTLQIGVDTSQIPKACAPVLAGLARLTLADSERPLPIEHQWVMLPFTEAFAACTATEPAAPPPRGVSKSIKTPKKIKDVPPVYPPDMQQQRVQGPVVVEGLINTQGCISAARVVRSPALGLSLASLRAVQGWLFTPTRFEGRPVPVWMTMTVNFTLR